MRTLHTSLGDACMVMLALFSFIVVCLFVVCLFVVGFREGWLGVVCCVEGGRINAGGLGEVYQSRRGCERKVNGVD